MPVRVELWQGGVLVDGVEQWWDRVESALDREQEDFALLDSISPYGQVRIPHERLMDLASECRRLALRAGSAVEPLLLKIADLCDRAAIDGQAELRFEGD